jgi:heme exporter protein A
LRQATRRAGAIIPAPMVELELQGVTKRFGGRRVLEGIDARARAGECLVITGRNGAGKSTLLQIIAGLQRPTRGSVAIRQGGRDMDADTRRDAIGLVSPDLALYAELTALENLELFAGLRGLQPPRAELVALLEQVGLEGRHDDRTGEFSSGMRVRLKYAAALLHAPALLLLDEPTANLDVSGVQLVEGLIEAQRRRGIVVLATNEPEETRFADQRISLGEA